MCDRKNLYQEIENLGNINFINRSDIYKNCTKEQAETFVLELVSQIHAGKIVNKHDWTGCIKKLRKEVHAMIGNLALNHAYLTLLSQKKITPSKLFRSFTVGHECRGEYGVLSVAVMTSPTPDGQDFSCKYNCSYCPDQPGSVKSYIRGGPTAERGFQNDYLPVEQMDDRLSVLFLNGHEIDKLEVLVLGGTWDSYPIKYQEWFITRLYYAANTFFDDKINSPRREILSLDEEKKINETTYVRIIGLTLETRPDQITSQQIARLHYYGCTRVQLGVQHVNDRILRRVKRDCYTIDTIRAIKNLKDVGLKVDIHLMPQLPGATVEDDRLMFNQINHDQFMQADQIKIYPCEVTPWTEIEKWFLDGEYQPYDNEDMIKLVIDYKTKVNPWIRFNRIGRDALPGHAIAGNPYPNLRQVIQDRMSVQKLKCRCIRCREVGTTPSRVSRINEAILIVRPYLASYGTEFFISMETPDEEIIFGFCRLRLTYNGGRVIDFEGKGKNQVNTDVNAFPYLNNHAFIRELHVYGRTNRVDNNNKVDIQHRGLGKKLVAKAEEIARSHGFEKMAIISGVGVREYYRKLGYQLEGAYMTKRISYYSTISNVVVTISLIYIVAFMIYFYLYTSEFDHVFNTIYSFIS
jgi:ELP3 family radical SAM enzyme/protein acetyltransferase